MSSFLLNMSLCKYGFDNCGGEMAMLISTLVIVFMVFNYIEIHDPGSHS